MTSSEKPVNGSSFQDVTIVVATFVAGVVFFSHRDRSPWVLPLVIALAFSAFVFLTLSEIGRGEMTMSTRRASIVCMGVWTFWLIFGASVPASYPSFLVVSVAQCFLSLWICLYRSFDMEAARTRVASIAVGVMFLVPVSVTNLMTPLELVIHTTAYVLSFYGLLYLRISQKRGVNPFHLACSTAWILSTPVVPFGGAYGALLFYVAFWIHHDLTRVAAASDEEPPKLAAKPASRAVETREAAQRRAPKSARPAERPVERLAEREPERPAERLAEERTDVRLEFDDVV